MKQLITFLFVCLSYVLSAQSLPKTLDVKVYRLDNGLTVWINEDHTAPKAYGMVAVKAGGADCPSTGIAHYFEHIMFKGTERIGTIDYNREKVYLDSISRMYDELALTTQAEGRRAIQNEINRLSIAASRYAIPNDYTNLITKYGGSSLNASTGLDHTLYYNQFTPNAFEQWAELNSERLMHPVFRLFQSELETVYEEKNREDDNYWMALSNKAMEYIFEGHPYSQTVLGTTANLKNPRLSQMMDFFETYYVAGNMGLLISGDVCADEILPIIMRTFGRIRSGTAPKRNFPAPEPFNGVITHELKMPFPLVKGTALIFRGIPVNHPDAPAVDIMERILHNYRTGLLDGYLLSGEFVLVENMSTRFTNAGIIGWYVMPKIFGKSVDKTNQLILSQMNRLKTGEYDDALIESVKMDLKKQFVTNLESLEGRTYHMANVFCSGGEWNDYLQQYSAYDLITKEDISLVAKEYLTDNYMQFTKKKGTYPSDKLSKPGYKPIPAQNKDAVSGFAVHLDTLPFQQLQPRLLDYEKDAEKSVLTHQATLYSCNNPLDDIFTLSFQFRKGTLADRTLSILPRSIVKFGTDSLSNSQFRSALQKIGSTITLSTSSYSTTVTVTGFDAHIHETIALLQHYLTRMTPDEKVMKQIPMDIRTEKAETMASPGSVAGLMWKYALFGRLANSFLDLTGQEAKKISAAKALTLFHELLHNVPCDISYCGTLSSEVLSGKLRPLLDCAFAKGTAPSNNPMEADRNYPARETILYDRPIVLAYDFPKARQVQICAYIAGKPLSGNNDRIRAEMLTNYLSGDMHSLLFQEIREFRSLAYSVSAKVNYSAPADEKPWIATIVALSTQNDKMGEAITVLDSILFQLPLQEHRFNKVVETLPFYANQQYPFFRDVAKEVAGDYFSGYYEPLFNTLEQTLKETSFSDFCSFYDDCIRNRTIVYIVVGDKRRMDLEGLSHFGDIKWVTDTELQ